MNKKIIISIICASFSLLIFSLVGIGMYLHNIQNKYGSIYSFFDINFHPEKYSFNYFSAKMLFEDDKKIAMQHPDYDTFERDFEMLFKKHSAQTNTKSKTITKYVNNLFDTQRAILQDDYKKIKIIKIEKGDLQYFDKDLLDLIYKFNMYIPQLEPKHILKEELYLKEQARKAIIKEFNIKIPYENINYSDFTQEDNFFRTMASTWNWEYINKECQTLLKEDKALIFEYNEISQKYQNTVEANLYGVAILNGKIYQKIFYKGFGTQFIAKDGKSQIMYKAKKALNGNDIYWEVTKFDPEKEAYQKWYTEHEKIKEETRKNFNKIIELQERFLNEI